MGKGGFSEKTVWSASLEMAVRITVLRDGSMYAVTADGVTYSPQEMKLAASNGAKFPKEVHMLKKLFGGTVVGMGKRTAPQSHS